MFGNDRPARLNRPIWVAAYDTLHLTCARCSEMVFMRDVAFFTRIRPGDAFDPWCFTCARQLCRWAAAGACLDTDTVSDETAIELQGILSNGRE